jgi:hypothetical protein
MSITTINGLLSGMRLPVPYIKVLANTPVIGTMYSMWLQAGNPGAGTAISNIGPSGFYYTCLSSQVPGQLRYINSSSDTNYLARFAGVAGTTGSIILADRIWADSLCWADTGKFPVYSGQFPRSAGLGYGDSSGTGVQLALEVYSTMAGGAGVAHKVTYFDSTGTADTATLTMNLPTSAVAGTFIPFYQGAGHSGFRSVSFWHNISNPIYTGGTYGLVAYRPIAQIQVIAPGVTDWIDAITSGFPLTFQNTVPMLIWVAGTATAPIIQGQFLQAHG